MKMYLQFQEVFERIVRSRFGLILLFIVISLIIGLFIVDDFGLSWDEHKDITYGETALNAYQGSDDFLWYGLNRKYYGPFYWMFVSLVSSFVETLGTDIPLVDVWKYIDFITFQLSIFSFFILCTRFMKRGNAFLTTLLFSLQPLLFGHAFINAKDIPFMSFFLTSVVLGLTGVDIFIRRFNIKTETAAIYLNHFSDNWRIFLGKWRATSRTTRIVLVGLMLLLIFSILEFFFLQKIFLPLMENVLHAAYDGSAPDPINSLFRSIAQDAYKTPIDLYIEKLRAAYAWGRVLVILALTILASLIGRKILLESRPRQSAAEWFRGHWTLLLAGLVLGLTISIRVAAPFAGALISLYFIVKAKHRAFIPLIIYWGIALAISYVTWPFLWGSPVDRFIESVNVSTAFIQRETLFLGTIIKAIEMPWFYLPKMMAIQFTEPLLLLFLAGIVVSVAAFRKEQTNRLELLLLLIWGGFPLALIILMRVPVYDNFRQFFFLMPPLIGICGLGLSKVMSLTKEWQLKVLVITFILLPGLLGIIQLHPYEYIYYNALVGGVEGANETYELDYWCTSLKESMDYINSVAAPNSSVVIGGPLTAALPFSREDIKINNANTYGDSLDYAIACRYAIWDPEFFPEFKIVSTVSRRNGILSIIRARE